eukprot:2769021-Pyramimonas_sp.AAC.1
MRRRLGIAISTDGADPHGRARQTEPSRWHARHKTVVTAWRQVMVEAGGTVPDRNVERLLADTNVPVPPGDLR